MKRLLLSLFILLPLPAFASNDVQDACNSFYKQLDAAPHYSLKLNTGELRSLSDDSLFNGCEVAWKSNVQLMKDMDMPSFEAEEGSELYKEGWRIKEHYRADGAGSGAYGIERGDILCLIHWNQYSYYDEITQEIITSDEMNMTVQCMKRNLPRP